jgi:hypothetical protein
MALTEDAILMRHIANNGLHLPRSRTVLENIKTTAEA